MWLPAVTAALDLGVIEAFAADPLSVDDLADGLNLRTQRWLILLRMLASLDLLAKHADTYQLTPVARSFLLKESPYYWGYVLTGGSAKHPIAARICEAVRNPKADLPAEANAWESGRLTDEMAANIARFMNSHSIGPAFAVAGTNIFHDAKRLLDIGGGSGCFSIAIAQRNARLRATVLDLPPMCRAAGGYIEAAGVKERVDTIGLDMFREPWPQGYDALFFSNIFHDWAPQVCAQLATKAYAACAPGGRIHLHEILVDDTGAYPRSAAAFSVMMLGATKGQQFTFAELRDLLTGAGFETVSVLTTYGYYSVVSAYKRK